MDKHLSPQPAGQPRGHRATLVLRRAALVVGLLLIGAGSALIGFSIFKHESPIQLLAQTLVPSPQQVFGKPNVLVLVEGLDYNYTPNDIEFSAGARSDIIKVVNLDFTDKNIYVLSVPRDMLATYPDGTQQKINAAQADGGEKEAAQVISSFLGIPGFDRYAIFRIDATKDLVNAIGGVNVYVKTSDCLWFKTGCTGGRIDYDDNWGHLHVHFAEGMQHMDGSQAVAYSRFRHDWCSDPCRIMRQDQVIQAVIDKLKGDKLNTLLSASNLLNVVKKDVQTNLTQNEILSLATYFSGIGRANVHFAELPYTSDVEMPDGDDLIPDTAARTRLVQSMLIAPPTPEPSPDAMELAGVPASSLKVDIENGSGVNGAAALAAKRLRAEGFTIGSIGNAASSDHATTQIREHSTVTFAGAKVRWGLPLALQGLPIKDDDPSAGSQPRSSDVTLVVGRDLAEMLVAKRGAPTP
jgi:LCP family protein required for cell wall assembly